MNLAFSTRDWGKTWEEYIQLAKDNRFGGIEIDPSDAAFQGKSSPLQPAKSAGSKRILADAKLMLPALRVGVDIADKQQYVDNYNALENAITIARNMNIPYLRVSAQKGTVEDVIFFLDKILPIAQAQKVEILLETTGIFTDTKILRDVLNEMASDFLGADWHMYDTYHNGEASETTIQNLGAYVKLVHLADAEENGSFTFIGEGVLPLEDMMNALRSINYDGYLVVEWDKNWVEGVSDLEIILTVFYNRMKQFESPSKMKKNLYYNHDHTGQYVWAKNALVDLTFSQVLDRMVQEFPDQYAFKYTTLDYTRTYREFRDDVDTFARVLISMGVKAGSHVAVWATNVPQWYITFWAASKIGAVLVTVNTAYKIHEAEYLLRQSDTHTLVMIHGNKDSNYVDTMMRLCPELKQTKKGEPLHAKRLPFLRNIITVGFAMDGCLEWEEAMERYQQVPLEEVYRMAAKVESSDVCNMQYTSGTTGFPKGVMLTHYNVVNDGKIIGDRMGLSTADRMMIQVPMFHCFGMVLSMTASMTHGATLCPLPYFSPKSSLACINQERITCFNGVPTMFIAMFNHPDYRKTDFSYMRTGIMAGSGCPAELMRRAAQPDEMNMTGIVSVYGQTESAPGSTMSAWQDPLDIRCETVGYPFPHIECKIIDPETGEEVPEGANGEFCSRGYNTMKGYYKMPEATKKAIDEEGWLHSGDLACRTPEGNYMITGRLKDMIIRGGENIYPKEIEDFIYTHPKVRDVQVIGVPDKAMGEEIMACIILKEGESMTADEMKSYVLANMAKHKVPKYVEYVDRFPMNDAGKILKYKMREEAAKKLGLIE